MLIAALDKKLVRDLWHMRGQTIAIAPVIAAGVATLILAIGAHRSLSETRRAYYERYRFADAFAQARRAPNHLREALARIPGVSAVETRIAGSVILDIEGLTEPVSGRLVSLPPFGEPQLNALNLRILGFTRGEVSKILLGEIAILVVLAIPLGWAIGYGLALIVSRSLDTELYRVPFIIERATYAKAALAVIAAAVAFLGAGRACARGGPRIRVLAAARSRGSGAHRPGAVSGHCRR